MNDQRVAFLRGLLEALVDSLDATVRIARWDDGDPVPEPLEKSASLLQSRLGAANRSAAGKFVGSPKVLAATSALTAAIRRLDDALVVFHRDGGDASSQREHAIATLEREVHVAREAALRSGT